MTLALGLLGRVPVWAWLLAGLLAYAGWQRAGVLELRGELAQQRAEIAQAEARASEQARREEFRRAEAIQGVINDATIRADRALADARRARGAAERLRAQLAATAASAAASDPAAAGAGDAAAYALRVHSELLGQCVERVRALARAADQARGAGLACESAYRALTPAAEGPAK